MVIEKNDLVFGSVANVAISKAGINVDKILLLFNIYNDLTDSQKYKYDVMLANVMDRDLELKFTWKKFLLAKSNVGTDIDKKNANEITNFVVNHKGNSLYAVGSDGAKIQNIMKQYTDSYSNKDNSKSNYRYTINNFDITSIDGNTGKAKVGYLVQSLAQTKFPNYDTHEIQEGFYISSQSQFVFNVTFTKNVNGDWKISNFDRTGWYNSPSGRMIYVE
jgi:hypothetical protein